MAETHISFSAIDRYKFCPNAYKIIYVDGAPRTSNIFTVFGKAIHSTVEQILLEQITKENSDESFKRNFLNIAKEEELEIPSSLDNIFQEMIQRGGILSVKAVEELYKKFNIKKIIGIEEELLEPIFHPRVKTKKEYDFKGYVDLILELEDGSWILLDWKTCSWGWDAKRKSDTLKQYQLTLYKHFTTLKKDVDSKKIKETYFVLIKRSAFKKDGTPKENAIEFVRVTCGDKKVQNSLKVLNNVMLNIDKEHFPKNRLSCSKCDFYKTQWCDA